MSASSRDISNIIEAGFDQDQSQNSINYFYTDMVPEPTAKQTTA